MTAKSLTDIDRYMIFIYIYIWSLKQDHPSLLRLFGHSQQQLAKHEEVRRAHFHSKGPNRLKLRILE